MAQKLRQAAVTCTLQDYELGAVVKLVMTEVILEMESTESYSKQIFCRSLTFPGSWGMLG